MQLEHPTKSISEWGWRIWRSHRQMRPGLYHRFCDAGVQGLTPAKRRCLCIDEMFKKKVKSCFTYPQWDTTSPTTLGSCLKRDSPAGGIICTRRHTSLGRAEGTALHEFSEKGHPPAICAIEVPEGYDDEDLTWLTHQPNVWRSVADEPAASAANRQRPSHQPSAAPSCRKSTMERI